MRRRVKFTEKSHSRRGIASTAAGILAIGLTAGILAAAYETKGQADKWIAPLGFMAFLLALRGAIWGARGTLEEEVYQFFPWFGVILNGMLIAVYAAIYVLGW